MTGGRLPSWDILTGPFLRIAQNMVASIYAASSRSWPYGNWFRPDWFDGETGFPNNQMGIENGTGAGSDRGLWVRDWRNSSVQAFDTGGTDLISTIQTETHPTNGLHRTVVVAAGSANQWLDSSTTPFVTSRSTTLMPAFPDDGTDHSEVLASNGTGRMFVSYSFPMLGRASTTGFPNDANITSSVVVGNGVGKSTLNGGTY